MSFLPLGRFVARFWPVLPLAWIALLAALSAVAPNWKGLVTDGDFKFLPAGADSVVAERVAAAHFDRGFRGGAIVVIARRAADAGPGLTAEDRRFVGEILAPRIQAVADEKGWTKPAAGRAVPLVAKVAAAGGPLRDDELGPLLDSGDGRATLVLVGLTTELTERKNEPVIDAVRRLIDRETGDLRREGLIPAGLDLFLSGPAVVGKDMRDAARDGARATEKATVALVVVLLILIYRAPILALIPLVTVAVAVKVALGVLSVLAGAGVITLFNGAEVYVTVVMYGAGVDYCMFLMARYKEELEAGETYGGAAAAAIAKIGSPLVASAGTVIVGIGMMVFAEFGRFRQAGVAMSLSIVFVLLASLTLTPALLRMCGRWAFWPRAAPGSVAGPPAGSEPTRVFGAGIGRRFGRIWDDLADAIVRRPGAWWLGSTAAMLPLAVVGVLFFDRTTYGLLEELPPESPSVRGARAVQDHFPAGEAGPVGVLVEAASPLFAGPEGLSLTGELTDALWGRREELSIADVRSQSDPYGKSRPGELPGLVERRLRAHAARKFYVGGRPEGPPGHVARLDVVFDEDPFTRDSMDRLDRLGEAVREALPDGLAGARVHLVGATASIRDIKRVTNRDQVRVDLMVLAGVFAVLYALLRRVMIAAYLIVTVFFSYLVTLGATVAAFWALDPAGFAGLDWKVPMFLFTILVAVGEDYNIYLAARVEEEQRKRGGVAGVREGLARTGGIISGCGIIMAGTFCSLMFGSLAGMVQLGFALAFGVILDTFVVRPILVPAYLVMLNDGRFGAASRWLGAFRPEECAGPLAFDEETAPVRRLG